MSLTNQCGREVLGMENEPNRALQNEPKSKTTRTDKSTKKRWSKAEKEQLIFCFYVATNKKTKETRQYRRTMRKAWLENDGDPQISEQALADMKQSILRSKYFTDTKLHEIEARAVSYLTEKDPYKGSDKEGGNVGEERMTRVQMEKNMVEETACSEKSLPRETRSPLGPIVREEATKIDRKMDESARRRKGAKKSWTKGEKEKLMICFFYATDLAHRTRHYRKRMRQEWLESKGDASLGEQALADMKQNIIRTKYFSEIELQRMRDKAKELYRQRSAPEIFPCMDGQLEQAVQSHHDVIVPDVENSESIDKEMGNEVDKEQRGDSMSMDDSLLKKGNAIGESNSISKAKPMNTEIQMTESGVTDSTECKMVVSRDNEITKSRSHNLTEPRNNSEGAKSLNITPHVASLTLLEQLNAEKDLLTDGNEEISFFKHCIASDCQPPKRDEDTQTTLPDLGEVLEVTRGGTHQRKGSGRDSLDNEKVRTNDTQGDDSSCSLRIQRCSQHSKIRRKGKKVWSKPEKEKLMICFYYATDLAHRSRHYRKRMRNEWLECNGDSSIGEQALADMKQSILRTKYFSDIELQRLRDKAKEVRQRRSISEIPPSKERQTQQTDYTLPDDIIPDVEISDSNGKEYLTEPRKRSTREVRRKEVSVKQGACSFSQASENHHDVVFLNLDDSETTRKETRNEANENLRGNSRSSDHLYSELDNDIADSVSTMEPINNAIHIGLSAGEDITKMKTTGLKDSETSMSRPQSNLREPRNMSKGTKAQIGKNGINQDGVCSLTLLDLLNESIEQDVLSGVTEGDSFFQYCDASNSQPTKEDNQKLTQLKQKTGSSPTQGNKVSAKTSTADLPSCTKQMQRMQEEILVGLKENINNKNCRKQMGACSLTLLEQLDKVLREPRFQGGINEDPHVHHPEVSINQQRTENETERANTEMSMNVQESTTESQYTTDEDQGLEEQLLIALKKNYQNVKEIPMSDRPHIPKIDTRCCTTTKVISVVDQLLKEVEPNPSDMRMINCLLWAGAKTVVEQIGLEMHSPNQNGEHKPKIPEWKRRIQSKIEELHKDVAQLGEMEKGNTQSKKMRSNGKRLDKKYRIDGKTRTRIIVIETLKMKINALKQRIKRYTKSNAFKRQNKLFHGNRKKFFRELRSSKSEVREAPPTEETSRYWKALWENDVIHREAPWIQSEKEKWENVPAQQLTDLTLSELQNIIKSSQNWNSPGPDGLQNFWIKKFSTSHIPLLHAINDIVKGVTHIEAWLPIGRTYLLYKGNDSTKAKNYRPITCLNTMYKLLTSTLARHIERHIDDNDIMEVSQKGCRKGKKGCKDHLLTNKAITGNARQRQTNLSMAWIDYKKAYDSVPHSWIIKIMEVYHIDPHIIQCISESMKLWNTTLTLTTDAYSMKVDGVRIKRGIFQGDSLSPLLFCLALNPVSSLLQATNFGYRYKGNDVTATVNHLVYMDDIKLYAKNDDELQSLIAIVKQFTDDIRMEFGIEKCAKITLIRGRRVETGDMPLSDEEVSIKELTNESTYKYLGMIENDSISHNVMKEKAKTEYKHRLRLIMKSELNAKNKMEAINTLAIPVLRYSFGIINWKIEDIRGLDVMTRKQLTMHRLHHPKAAVERLYLPRDLGGRGLQQIETVWNMELIQLANYLSSPKDTLTNISHDYDKAQPIYSSTKQALKTLTGHQIALPVGEKEKTELKRSLNKRLQTNLQAKRLHGHHEKQSNRQFVDKKNTHGWLKSAGLKGETEGFIFAIQDQVIKTRAYEKSILQSDVEDTCRVCGKEPETLMHLASGCPILAQTEYISRHDNIAKHIHWQLLKDRGTQACDHPWEHQPQTITLADKSTIYWNCGIMTDRAINCNKPDIIVREGNKVNIIEVSVPHDINIAVKERDKRLKYQDLRIEIERMWNAKAEVTPVIIGHTGMVKKGIESLITKISPNIKIYDLQKEAILGTTRMIRKTLGH